MPTLSDEKQCFIIIDTMKQSKQNIVIGALFLLLSLSLLFNYLQGNQVSRLMEEIEVMEYIQKALSDQLDMIEQREEMNYDER